MFGIGTQEVLLILLIVLLLFGGKKIPELMKGLGKGVKSFRDGMNGVERPEDGRDTGRRKGWEVLRPAAGREPSGTTSTCCAATC